MHKKSNDIIILYLYKIKIGEINRKVSMK